MFKKPKAAKNQGKATIFLTQGFTLIELSIVLVIIGLIVGGVLVGQDLIRAAEIRATVSQIEKYNTAVNTFRGKYGYIPGDLPAAQVNQFQLTTGNVIPATATVGDGSGLIEGGAVSGSTTGSIAFTGEPVLFWNELTVAGYMDGSYGATGLTAAGDTGGFTASVANWNLWIPPAKLGRGNSVNVVSVSGLNYYALSGYSGAVASGTGSVGAGTNNLTPTEAYNIDKKVDDGLPATGIVKAIDGTAAANALAGVGSITTAGVGTTNCAGTNGNTAYAVGTQATTQACSLLLRFN